MRILGILGLLLASSIAVAAPTKVPVQGVMVDSDGEQLDGDYNVTFRVYDLAQPDSPVWESVRTVNFLNGFFSVYLGDGVALERDLFILSDDLALTLAIEGDDESGPIALGSAPFALNAEHAWEAESLEGATLDDILGQIPDQASLDASIAAVCYDTPAELTAVLDSVYLPSTYVPDWADLQGVPSDLADGDDDTVYLVGEGLLLDTDTLNVDQEQIEDWALAVTNAPGALDLVIEDYLTNIYQPSYLDLVDIPADLLDGDDDTTYLAGDGLWLVGDTFSVDDTLIQNLARAACYDTIPELRGALDAVYLGSTWRPNWSEVQGIPADLLDGDDDTTYSAGNGLTLSGTEFVVDNPVIEQLARDVAYDAESELLAVLADDYKPLSYQPDWTEIQNLPAWLADGDDDTLQGLICSPGQIPKWDGAEWQCSDAAFSGDLSVGGDLGVAGNLSVGGDLSVGGAVDADELSGALITAGTLDATDVTASGISADDISSTSADIGSLTGGSVSVDTIGADSVSVASGLTAGSAEITGAMVSGSVATGAVTATSVDASSVSASSLSATGAITGASLEVTGMVTGAGGSFSNVNSNSISAVDLDVSGSVTGNGFAGWDRNNGDDLTLTTGFGGDVSGSYNNIAVANDSHLHGNSTVSDDISVNNGILYAPAGGTRVGIGTVSPAGELHVRQPDSTVAEVFIMGDAQGSGMMYVGQSSTYGGGIRYDGDSTPTPLGTADRVTFFRRSAGTDTVVFDYSYLSSTVAFKGSITVAGNVNVTGTLYANVSTYDVNTLITASNRCATCNSGDSVLACSMNNLDGCTGNPCDADPDMQAGSSRCCAGSNDQTGWVIKAYCMTD